MIEIDESDLYWLAGILEAEGSFVLSKQVFSGKQYLYARVQMASSDEDIVARVASLCGSRYWSRQDHRKDHYKDVHHFHARHAVSVEVMQLLLPLMSSRRQAQIATVLSHPGLRPVREEISG